MLNRLAEDGVLVAWFRKPHKKFGTSSRLINAIVILQIATIIASRGDVNLLGQAYAFGVVWSFFMKALGVLVLRFRRHDQEYKTPLNIHVGGRELPIGLALTTLTLFFVFGSIDRPRPCLSKRSRGSHAMRPRFTPPPWSPWAAGRYLRQH